jgi:hypothetical protein
MTDDQKALLNRRISEARAVNGIYDVDDYTGDDRANCVLLDEMPEPNLYLDDEEDWNCVLEKIVGAVGISKERRIAVCLAWCRWKGVALDGITEGRAAEGT